uniref:hypothetical protein n=1 Tax=Ruminococcus bromii TaxID=40518 RepID=UPI003FEE9BA3
MQMESLKRKQKGGDDLMYEMNFINNCLYGLTDIDEIDDYVEAWHNGQSNLKLSDYLGMTQDEYEAWIQKDDSVLRDILRCRADGIAFGEYQNMTCSEKIAARSTSIDDIRKIQSDDDDKS